MNGSHLFVVGPEPGCAVAGPWLGCGWAVVVHGGHRVRGSRVSISRGVVVDSVTSRIPLMDNRIGFSGDRGAVGGRS